MDSPDESHLPSADDEDRQEPTLKIPELLSHVLNQLDLDSLQNVRLVSKLWSDEAAQILFSCCWISEEPTLIGGDQRLANYQRFKSVLSGSLDPSKFFRRFIVSDRFFLWAYNPLLVTYGKFLRSLKLKYLGVGGHSGYSIEFLIHQILNEYSPQLEELWVCDEEPSIGQLPPGATLVPQLSGRLNLRHVDLSHKYQDIVPQLQSFYLEMLKLSPKLVKLGLNFGSDSSSFYKKLYELTNVTQGLRSFSWHIGGRRDLHREFISSIKFSRELHTLRIYDVQFDPRDIEVQMFLSSIPNLRKLELIRYSAMEMDDHETTAEREAKGQLLNVIMQYLPNLETLLATCDDNFDYFPLFDGLIEIKNLCSDNKLKTLIYWGCDRCLRICRRDGFDPIVNFFPNLTTVALKVEIRDETYSGIRKVSQVIKGLMSLSNLRKLCLDVDVSVSQEDVTECIRYLTVFLSLTRFALVCNNVNLSGRTGIIAFTPKLEAALLAVRYLSQIRLIGFQTAEEDRERMLDYVRTNHIPLECYTSYVFKDEDDYLYRTLLTDQLSPKTFLC